MLRDVFRQVSWIWLAFTDNDVGRKKKKEKEWHGTTMVPCLLCRNWDISVFCLGVWVFCSGFWGDMNDGFPMNLCAWFASNPRARAPLLLCFSEVETGDCGGRISPSVIRLWSVFSTLFGGAPESSYSPQLSTLTPEIFEQVKSWLKGWLARINHVSAEGWGGGAQGLTPPVVFAIQFKRAVLFEK